MFELLKQYENKPPEIVFEWHDKETEAVGWVVINVEGGGAGGTRMRVGLESVRLNPWQRPGGRVHR